MSGSSSGDRYRKLSLQSAAVGLGAAGLGIFVLLACWSASLFWRDNIKSEKIGALIKRTEAIDAGLKDGKSEIVTEVRVVGAKVDVLGNKIDALDRHLDTIDSDLLSVSKRVAQIDIRKYEPGTHEDPKIHTIIQREVTVFNNVKHADGFVVTGWKFKDGSATEPYDQFCYYTLKLGDTGVDFKVDIALNGNSLYTEGVNKVPDIKEALGKCQWYGGRIN